MDDYISVGIPEQAIGLLIDIQDTGKMKKMLNDSGAKNKAEVVVKFNGEIMEFTFDGFLERLGFGGGDK